MKKLFTSIAAALMCVSMLNAAVVLDGNAQEWAEVPIYTEPGTYPMLKFLTGDAALGAENAFAALLVTEDAASMPSPVVFYVDADKNASTGTSPWLLPAMGYEYEIGGWDGASSTCVGNTYELLVPRTRFNSTAFTGSFYTMMTNWNDYGIPVYPNKEVPENPTARKWAESARHPFEVGVAHPIVELGGTHAAADAFTHYALALGATLNFVVSGGNQDVALWASWPVELTTPGTYTVSANITSTDNASCDLYLVDMATNAVVATYTSEAIWAPTGETELGDWDLSAVTAGKYMLKMKNHVEWSHMVLSSVTLTYAGASDVDISLGDYTIVGGSTEHLSTPVIADGALSATLTSTGDWENAGVEFALNNVTGVRAISYEYKGSTENTVWTSFQVYLVDENDIKWIRATPSISISGGPADWTPMEYMPTDELWTEGHTQGTTFKAIGFLANPMNPTTAAFSIRNIKVICTESSEPETPTYELTVTAAGMSTLMLPFTVSALPTGVKAYDLTVEDAEIIATEVSAITPDQPVLIVAEAGTYTFEGEGSAEPTGSIIYSHGALHGTYVGCQVPTFESGEYCYVLQNHEGDVAFYQVVESSNHLINSYRAYLRASYNALGAASVGPRMRIVFQGQTVTSAEQNTDALSLEEALRQGQVFDLVGRRVTDIKAKGLYVTKGRTYLAR